MRTAQAIIDETETETADDLRSTGVRERQAPDVAVTELHGDLRPSAPFHLANVRPLVVDARAGASPERLRSARRRAGRALDAATLDEACKIANASHAEAGAAWDRSREQAREVRAGERPVEPHLGIENAPSDEAAAACAVLWLVRLAKCRPAAFARVLQIVGGSTS